MICGKRSEDRFLAGIVMGGSEKCASHLPGFYTEVSKFRQWIDSKLGATADIESNNSNDSINVKPNEELNPRVAKSEAPREQITTSQVIPSTNTEDENVKKKHQEKFEIAQKILENSNDNINNDKKNESTEPPKETEAQTVSPVASSEVIIEDQQQPTNVLHIEVSNQTEVSNHTEALDFRTAKENAVHNEVSNHTEFSKRVLHSKTFSSNYFVPIQRLQNIAKVLNIGKQISKICL